MYVPKSQSLKNYIVQFLIIASILVTISCDESNNTQLDNNTPSFNLDLFEQNLIGLKKRLDAIKGLHLLDPMGYLDFLKLQSSAAVVLTDSGGIQEETTALRIPCITLRDNTERPITAEIGSNQVVGTDTQKIIAAYEKIASNNWRTPQIPPLWDGKASQRIVKIVSETLIA